MRSKAVRAAANRQNVFVEFEPTHLCLTLALPGSMLWAEPMHPEASSPRVSVERAHSENTPLLRLPGRVEPKGLGEHSEDTRPSAPTCALVLRKPDRDDATKGDADLIQAHGLLLCGAALKVPSQHAPNYASRKIVRMVQNGAVYGLRHTCFGGGLLARHVDWSKHS